MARKRRSGVKGYIEDLTKVAKKRVDNIRDPEARYEYETNTRNGFSTDWSTWYNYTMAKLIEKADDWVDKSGAEKVLAISKIVKEASATYREAKLKLFAQRAKAELEQTVNLIEEVTRAAVGA